MRILSKFFFITFGSYLWVWNSKVVDLPLLINFSWLWHQSRYIEVSLSVIFSTFYVSQSINGSCWKLSYTRLVFHYQINKILHSVSTIQPWNSWFHYLQRICTKHSQVITNLKTTSKKTNQLLNTLKIYISLINCKQSRVYALTHLSKQNTKKEFTKLVIAETINMV